MSSRDEDDEESRSHLISHRDQGEEGDKGGPTSDDEKLLTRDRSTTTDRDKFRWIQLALFTALCFESNAAWLTFAPIADIARAYYAVSDLEVNFFSLVFMIAVVILGLPASFITENIGPRASVMICSILSIVGCLLRVLPYPFLDPRSADVTGSSRLLSYAFAMTGQTVLAIAQIFVVSSPILVTDQWFTKSERVTALGFVLGVSSLGALFSYALPPLVLNADLTSKQQSSIPLYNLLIAHAVICCLISVPNLIFFRNKPSSSSPSPSSSSSSSLSSVSFLLRSRPFLTLLFVCGFLTGVSFTLSTLLNTFMTAANFDDQQVAIAGTLMALASLLSCIFFGWLVDLTAKHRLLIMLCAFLTALACIPFAIFNLIHNEFLLYLVCFLSGFFFASSVPVAMDLSVDISYPHSMSIAAQLLTIFANIFSIILVIVLPIIKDHYGASTAGWFLSLLTFLTLFVWMSYDGVSKRVHDYNHTHSHSHDSNQPNDRAS